MRGGTRSNKGPRGVESVRELMDEAQYAAAMARVERIADLPSSYWDWSIVDVNKLNAMTPDERIGTYISINEINDAYAQPPSFQKQFNKIFHEYFNEDALRAREFMVSRMRVPGNVHVGAFHTSNVASNVADDIINRLDGGKTRRNRRRRNRRSLKRKHSRRR